eukprot:SAG11_NODE_10313_length_840_cov_1.412955_1_plen_39_part_01
MAAACRSSASGLRDSPACEPDGGDGSIVGMRDHGAAGGG